MKIDIKLDAEEIHAILRKYIEETQPELLKTMEFHNVYQQCGGEEEECCDLTIELLAKGKN